MFAKAQPLAIGTNPKERWGLIGSALRMIIEQRQTMVIGSYGYVDRALNQQQLSNFAQAYRTIWDNVAAAQADPNPYNSVEHFFACNFESLADIKLPRNPLHGAEIANTIKMMANQLDGPTSEILRVPKETNDQMVEWLKSQYQALNNAVPFPPVSVHSIRTQNKAEVAPTSLDGLKTALAKLRPEQKPEAPSFVGPEM
jgi:hypothetical protein